MLSFDVSFNVVVLLKIVPMVKKISAVLSLTLNRSHFVVLVAFFFFTFQFAKKAVIHQPCWNRFSSLTPSAGTTGINSADEQRISVF